MSIRKVHVVFKTHLDIGFTDLAQSVIDHYLEKYIPAALACAASVNRPGRPPMFIWTVGSYLIDLALRTYTGEKWNALDSAIREGHITYHALPFTMHSELCDKNLFKAGLDIAAQLDRKYSRKTIAAKMSDVPGHTIGIVAPLAESGIEYLHIGINGVALMPKVPPIFVWQNSAGQSIIVDYCRSYGGVTEVEGHDEALCFMHSQDNMGPPSPEHLQQEFDSLQKRYPGAVICASTLNAFAKGLARIRGRLPVITQEIGDTWIHGTGSDPRKVSALKALLRLNDAWNKDGIWAKHNIVLEDGRNACSAFLTELLLICEHTWGLDVKKYLADYQNWNRSDFEAARKRDRLSDAYGQVPGCEAYFTFGKEEFHHLHPSSVTWDTRSYSFFESSHEEQRQYLVKAMDYLPGELKEKAESVINDPESETHELLGETASVLSKGPIQETCLNGIHIRYQPDGSITLSPEGCEGIGFTIGSTEYHEVGQNTYKNLAERFLSNMEEHKGWAVPDYLKPGLEFSDAPAKNVTHRPVMRSAMYAKDGALYWSGEFPQESVASAGCPQRFESSLRPLADGGLLLTVWLKNKPANRKPDTLFLPLSLPGDACVQYQKVGAWLSPKNVIEGGNERCHAVQSIRIAMPNGDSWLLTPLDTPLVAAGNPNLLDFSKPDRWDRLYFGLYNNLWGTNFKMWYGEDILFRLILTFEGRKQK